MKRRLAIELEVGDAAEGECGECPFRALTGRYFCMCPSWEPQEVTDGRHRECLEAGDETARAEEAWRIVEAARHVLACVAESMPEHVYQELASALEAPPRLTGEGDGVGVRR